MPKSIADRINDNDIRIADSFDSVTILFADIVGFTQISANMPPADLDDLLSQIFSRFDQLAETHGLEKIKTIGDGYMVVGGVPLELKNHAVVEARLALDMQVALQDIA